MLARTPSVFGTKQAFLQQMSVTPRDRNLGYEWYVSRCAQSRCRVFLMQFLVPLHIGVHVEVHVGLGTGTKGMPGGQVCVRNGSFKNTNKSFLDRYNLGQHHLFEPGRKGPGVKSHNGNKLATLSTQRT